MRISVVLLTAILLIAGCGPANDSASGDGQAPDSSAAAERDQATGLMPGAGEPGDGDGARKGVSGEGLRPGGTTHVFDCGAPGADSISVTMRVDSTRAWLWLPQDIRMQPVRLEQLEAASGARYEGSFDDTPVGVWNKGQEAIFEIGTQRYDSCTRNNYRSVWEDAKLGGIDFRALGNEPGWLVDVYVDDRFDVQWRYGERTAELPYMRPEMPDESTTVFRSETDEHSHVMTLKAGGCTDTMSGFAFPVAVTIRIDGSEYTGCGRPLH